MAGHHDFGRSRVLDGKGGDQRSPDDGVDPLAGQAGDRPPLGHGAGGELIGEVLGPPAGQDVGVEARDGV